MLITKEQLEFSVFCIESVALQLNIKGNQVYSLLSDKSDILYGYIIQNYEILHTQSKDYIVEDIVEYMKEEGVINNKILLQRKYSRIIELFSEKKRISLEKALDIFYRSELYQEMSEGISDMHCRSDNYLAEELEQEYNQKNSGTVSYMKTENDEFDHGK